MSDKKTSTISAILNAKLSVATGEWEVKGIPLAEVLADIMLRGGTYKSLGISDIHGGMIVIHALVSPSSKTGELVSKADAPEQAAVYNIQKEKKL